MEPRIVGIVLVRNEDRFVRRAVENISAFCDEILLCDHGSTDRTPEILREISGTGGRFSFHALRHPSESHDLLQKYVGTPTWVFGVDGDEIYDPARLVAFRARLLDGEFEDVWRMKGNVLHCTELDADRGVASGYLAAPSRSITKLYNLGAIERWDGDTVERLHGGTIRFRPGFDDAKKRNFQETLSWEETPLRCLHLCFLRRSSLEEGRAPVRENIMEIYRGSLWQRWSAALRRLVGGRSASRWKTDHYRRGDLVTKDVGVFFDL